MNKLLSPVLFALIGIMLVPACSYASSTTRQPTSPPVEGTVSAAKADGTQRWDDLLAGARKEGEVMIYSNLNADTRTLLSRAFGEKYGINLNFVTVSSGSEVFARAASEKRAGIHAADVFTAGSTNFVTELKPEGLLGGLDTVVFLPEVTDPQAWRDGKLPFTDKDHLSIYLISSIWGAYLRNTDLVKENEITSYADVLKPVYKGKITMSDPSVTGSASFLVAHLAQNLWDIDRASDFLTRLVKQQEAMVTRDLRLQVEWISRGRYAIGLGPDTKQTASFMNVQAPLALVWPAEGAYSSTVGGSMGISSQPAHPKATAVFINWILTQEGQTLFTQGFGQPSTRLDVKATRVDPKLLPPPGHKIFSTGEEFINTHQKMLPYSKNIIAQN